jgi:hypothetical protein
MKKTEINRQVRFIYMYFVILLVSQILFYSAIYALTVNGGPAHAPRWLMIVLTLLSVVMTLANIVLAILSFIAVIKLIYSEQYKTFFKVFGIYLIVVLPMNMLINYIATVQLNISVLNIPLTSI